MPFLLATLLVLALALDRLSNRQSDAYVYLHCVRVLAIDFLQLLISSFGWQCGRSWRKRTGSSSRRTRRIEEKIPRGRILLLTVVGLLLPRAQPTTTTRRRTSRTTRSHVRVTIDACIYILRSELYA